MNKAAREPIVVALETLDVPVEDGRVDRVRDAVVATGEGTTPVFTAGETGAEEDAAMAEEDANAETVAEDEAVGLTDDVATGLYISL